MVSTDVHALQTLHFDAHVMMHNYTVINIMYK